MKFVEQLARFIGGPSESSRELLRDIHETVLLECDYEREAEMQHRHYQAFVDDPNIVIPKVHFSHSRKHILTTEWIDGSSWSNFRKSAGQFERNRAAATIARFYARSGFGHKMIHGDPHPGNFLFSGSKVAILDFGRVRTLSDATRVEFRHLHELILSRDKDETKAFIQTSSFFQLGAAFDFEQFWTVLGEMSWHLQFDGDVIFSRDLMAEQRGLLRELAQTFSIKVSPDFFWAMLFVHPLMIAGRADLGAAGNWRQSLETNM
jgi:predicted unusual protein kinase regulating ubiquinone biosynthesis (AarF/ABC1/UbiB family)